MASYGLLLFTRICSGKVMKICFLLAILLVMYTNGCCRETGKEYDAPSNKVDDPSANLTSEEDDSANLFANLMRPQKFTVGTLLGLLVASAVVVIGSFLVLWRVCCDVEMRVTREVVLEPLKSISHAVGQRTEGRSVSGESLLLGHGCSASSVLEIA